MPDRRGRSRGQLAAERASAVIAAYRAEPCTYDDVAQPFDISRERVRQILDEHDVPRWTWPDILANRRRDRDRVVREMWDAGVHPDDMALALGLGRATIDLSLRRVLTRRERYAQADWHPERVDDEAMLEQLRECARQLGHTPGVKAFDKFYGCHRAQLYMQRFGSWARACEAAGLKANGRPPSERVGVRTYSDQDVRDAYVRISAAAGDEWLSLGRWDKLRQPGREPTAVLVRNRYGGRWRQFLLAMRLQDEAEAELEPLRSGA